MEELKKEQINDDIRRNFLAGTFVYEFNKAQEDFFCMMSFLKSSPKKPQVPEPVLCAFLLHIRNLNKFFYGPKWRWDTAHAKDYLPEWEGKKDSVIYGWMIKINCFLQHMSYKRVKGEEHKSYPIDLFYNHFKQLTLGFVDELPERYASPELKKLRGALLESSLQEGNQQA